MSTKVANVIAIELGILIALLAWLAIARVPSVRLLPRAQERAQPDGSYATVAPVLRSSPQKLYAANDALDHRVFDAQTPDAESAPEYVQDLTTEPYTNPEDFGAQTSPYYGAVAPASAELAPDCYFPPTDQFVGFIQPPQIIILSNPRARGRSNRSPARFNGGGRTGINPRVNGGRMIPRNRGMTAPVRQTPRHAVVSGPRTANRGGGQVSSGRGRGGPISALQ